MGIDRCIQLDILESVSSCESNKIPFDDDFSDPDRTFNLEFLMKKKINDKGMFIYKSKGRTNLNEIQKARDEGRTLPPPEKRQIVGLTMEGYFHLWELQQERKIKELQEKQDLFLQEQLSVDRSSLRFTQVNLVFTGVVLIVSLISLVVTFLR